MASCAIDSTASPPLRVFTEVFTAEAKRPDLPAVYRDIAAQAAAQAGFGQGKDASKLTESERRVLRRDTPRLAAGRTGCPPAAGPALRVASGGQGGPRVADRPGPGALWPGPACKRVGAEERQAIGRLWRDIDRLVTATPQGQRAKGQWHAARREWLRLLVAMRGC